MSIDYPEVHATVHDDSTAELVEDYDMFDLDRTKVKPLKSASERYGYFCEVLANEAHGEDDESL